MTLRMESLSMLTIGPLLRRHGQRPVGSPGREISPAQDSRLAVNPVGQLPRLVNDPPPAPSLIVAILWPRQPLAHRHRLDGRAAPAGEFLANVIKGNIKVSVVDKAFTLIANGLAPIPQVLF